MLPKEAISEFKKLYADRFEQELSDEEAYLKASNFFELYKAVYASSSNTAKV